MKESEESLRCDPDVRLIPSTIEKIVVPKLTSMLSFIAKQIIFNRVKYLSKYLNYF